ncbi:hypothetical protein GOODEAATRI_027732, partial [Goodea atripinnis]
LLANFVAGINSLLVYEQQVLLDLQCFAISFENRNQKERKTGYPPPLMGVPAVLLRGVPPPFRAHCRRHWGKHAGLSSFLVTASASYGRHIASPSVSWILPSLGWFPLWALVPIATLLAAVCRISGVVD